MNKLNLLISLILAFTSSTLVAQDNTSALMPMVNSIQQLKQEPFCLNGQEASFYINDPSLDFVSQELQKVFIEYMNISCTKSVKKQAQIHLTINKSLGKEEYFLNINNKLLEITGGSKAGVFYGLKTLEQIMMGDVCNTKNKKIAAIEIKDKPRYSFRGLMVDPARHFLPIQDLKFFIDQMARYKYNKLQIHLTDDQGWRMEIKSIPELTSLGEYYTQEELTDLINYADDRNVEIIPELDVPGHVVALLATHPELGCTNTQNQPKEIGKTENMMLCAANDNVYTLYDTIISEVANLFPSSKIHMGGDEARIPKNWLQCEKCTALIKELGYTNGEQLMIPFFKKIKESVEKYNKELMLWCELDSEYAPANDYLFPYDKDITLISWRWGLTPTCLELTSKHENPIIMAPGEHAYLDYPQLKGDLPEFNNWGMPVTTLKQCYKFDPGYGYPQDKQNHVLGVLGTLWGEAMKDINRVTYMAFPRAFAIAEAGWTEMPHRNWNSFVERMYPNITNLMKKGVSVRVPFEIVERK